MRSYEQQDDAVRDYLGKWMEAERKLERLEAENARLREALERLVDTGSQIEAADIETNTVSQPPEIINPFGGKVMPVVVSTIVNLKVRGKDIRPFIEALRVARAALGDH